MTTKYINEVFWKESLTKPDWYVRLADDFKRLEKLAKSEKDYSKRKQIKSKAYELVEEAVQLGTLPLAKSGDDSDKERKPIDTIVIHHTNNPPGMSLERLNAIQLIRIYGMNFAKPRNLKEAHLKGKPLWSGHYYKGQQVFWGYHWVVRANGIAKQILKDNNIGWHAGNWDINTRSIGICIDDDLNDKEPSETVLHSIAEIIRMHYPKVSVDKIVGHCDINKTTECPGKLFHESWQQKLVNSLK